MSIAALPWWLAGILLVAGLLLLKTGLWPRRRGETPHCPVCDYNLTGLTGERCPECGTAVAPSDFVFGERHRRPVRAIIGILLLLMDGGLGVAAVSGVDWYPLVPVSLLIRQIDSEDAGTVGKAWAELNRRIKTGRLSAKQHTKLIDFALNEQIAATRGSLHSTMLDYLGDCCLKGLMSLEQQECFTKQFLVPTLKARSTVALGDDLPYKVNCELHSPSTGIWFKLGLCKDIRVDGKSVPQGERADFYHSGDGRIHPVSLVSTLEATAYTTPGKHTLTITPEIIMLAGSIQNPQAGMMLSTRRVPLEASFEVLAAESPNYIRAIENPSLKPRIQECICFQELRWIKSTDDEGSNSYSLYGWAHSRASPVDLAFDAFARIKGKEYPMTSVQVIHDQTDCVAVSCENAGPSQEPHIDIILRSSEKAVRRTLDQYAYWEGELIFKDVPVIVDRAATEESMDAEEEENEAD